MHKVFISYHHGDAYRPGDAYYKNRLLELNRRYQIFLDGSVDTGGIDDNLPDSRIREIIRDDYLRNTTVTVVLVGTGTKGRKHVDWEIYSSMYDGTINKRSGVLAIMLPSTGCIYFDSAHTGEKEGVYPGNTSWISIDARSEYERRYPHMPDRIIDNLLKQGAMVSVANWHLIEADPSKLSFLIEVAYKDRLECEYNLTRPMRRANS